VFHFGRAIDLVSIIGSNQDYPITKDLICSLSAIASAGVFEGNPCLPVVRLTGKIKLRVDFQIGCPTAAERDQAVVRGQIDLAERLEAILCRCNLVTLNFETRTVSDDARYAGKGFSPPASIRVTS